MTSFKINRLRASFGNESALQWFKSCQFNRTKFISYDLKKSEPFRLLVEFLRARALAHCYLCYPGVLS